MNKSRPLSTNIKREGEKRHTTGERGREKKRREKRKKALKIFFVCGEFDNNSKWYLFIYWSTF